MIEVFPDNVWLANAALAVIVVATAVLSALPTLRWGWKAWPLVLGAALATPIIIAAVLTVVVLLVADRIGVTSFFVHATTLALIGVASAVLGSGVALVLRSVRPKLR